MHSKFVLLIRSCLAQCCLCVAARVRFLRLSYLRATFDCSVCEIVATRSSIRFGLMGKHIAGQDAPVEITVSGDREAIPFMLTFAEEAMQTIDHACNIHQALLE